MYKINVLIKILKFLRDLSKSEALSYCARAIIKPWFLRLFKLRIFIYNPSNMCEMYI